MEKKYKFSELTEEEKQQIKDYANAIKETKKAMMEILSKVSKLNTEEKGESHGRWGGPRKNMIMPLKEKDVTQKKKN